MRVRGDRLGEQRAVHVGVAARLEHERAAQVVEPLHAPTPASRASSRPSGAGKPSTISRSGSPAACASIVRIVCTMSDCSMASSLVSLHPCARSTPTTSCCRCPTATVSDGEVLAAARAGDRATGIVARRVTCTKRRRPAGRTSGSCTPPPTSTPSPPARCRPTSSAASASRGRRRWSSASRRSVGATIAAARAALDDGAGREPRRRHAPRLRRSRRRLLRLQRRRRRRSRVLQRDTACVAHRGRRLRRAPGQRHGRHLQGRSRRLHLLDARRATTSRSARRRATSTSTSTTAPATTNTWRLLSAHLRRRARSATQPDLVFYLAGADPYEGDRLGRLKLTIAGLRARDELVLGALPRTRPARRHLDERRLRPRRRRHRHHPREHDARGRGPGPRRLISNPDPCRS